MSDEAAKQDPGASPLPADAERARREQLERERNELLADIAARVTDDLKRQVGYVLNLFPRTRNSDVALMLQLWKLFYPDELDGDFVSLQALYRLPKLTSITRVRAKIQNEYGLFAPSAEVQELRRARGEEVAEEMAADQPGPPMIAIHSDESGKTDRYLVVGSLWILDVVREAPLLRRLLDWKTRKGIAREFKFASLTRANLADAIEFVQTALVDSDTMGFKAWVVDQEQLKGWSVEDTVYRLYYELAMRGIEHEVMRGRVTLPRILALVKDADDGPDALKLPELERRLTVGTRDYFAGHVTVDSVETAKSDQSPFLQLADLFSGSVARVLNKTEPGTNQKDDFAAFFERVAGFPFLRAREVDQPVDFVYVHHLS